MKSGNQFTNKDIAQLLRFIASAYLLQNENRFKIIAYENAATTVEHLTREIHDLWQEGRMKGIPGIGPSIGSNLDELFRTGKSAHFDEVLKNIPPSVFELMKVPGIGPKKAYKMVVAFKFFNKETILADIVNAAGEGRIATLETFGEKSQEDILEAVKRYQKNSGGEERMPLPYAHEMAEKIIAYLKKHPAVKRADALGSLRRCVATIGDIDIAVQVKNQKLETRNSKSEVENEFDDVIKYFIEYPGKIAVDNAGKNKSSIIVPPNIRVDLRIQNAESYGSMLQYFTGSKAHNIKLREHALKKGYSLSEWGIKTVKKEELRVKNGEKSDPPAGGRNEKLQNNQTSSSGLTRGSINVGSEEIVGMDSRFRGNDANSNEAMKQLSNDELHLFKNEESFYEFIGVPYIEPEIREGTNEIDLALKNKLPKLIELKDIKGDFHLHSSYDLHPSHDFGANTYLEIAQKGHQLGYEYVGFADHNPKITGVSEDEIVAIMKARKEHIDKVFTTTKVPCAQYFIGLETDILPSGKLALPEEAIEYVDYLIVSVHSSFSMDIKEMTKRVLKAMNFPKVKILGHPTGRLLGKRDGYELDWSQIFETTKQKNIAIEINSWPQRLDLPDTLVREAKDLGCTFFINTDAHANEHMDNMKYGISVARRGWAEKKDVVNTMGYKDMKKWISKDI